VKRERQKYHVIMNFPLFFTLAACRFQREEAWSRVRQQREYFFGFFIPSASIINPFLSPVIFYLFFYSN